MELAPIDACLVWKSRNELAERVGQAGPQHLDERLSILLWKPRDGVPDDRRPTLQIVSFAYSIDLLVLW
ncbi:hypothetical protein [Rhizobium sp. BK176]|uniref:hypothetical protein n=1 Tax=Rhizobium sp. BK176 TaxID=2587071 RepID=UPI0021695D59|nr:hypothetical protein [Rhizobium sp. BK176]MCS4089187.1 hypothetical protein [Rhizobium sp. BK176]